MTTITDQINEAAALADYDTYEQLTAAHTNNSHTHPVTYCPTKSARGYKGTAHKKFKPKYLPSATQETYHD